MQAGQGAVGRQQDQGEPAVMLLPAERHQEKGTPGTASCYQGRATMPAASEEQKAGVGAVYKKKGCKFQTKTQAGAKPARSLAAGL